MNCSERQKIAVEVLLGAANDDSANAVREQKAPMARLLLGAVAGPSPRLLLLESDCEVGGVGQRAGIAIDLNFHAATDDFAKGR